MLLRRNEVEVPIDTPIASYEDLKSVEELLKEREHFEKYVNISSLLEII